MDNFWIGIASREHVRAAVHGGFCQLSHGKEAPVRRLKRGDAILFYSPRERMGDGEVLQAFTAAGEIIDDLPHQVKQGKDFHPFRRMTRYFRAGEAPIQPLLQSLTFTQGRSNWGMAFRRGVFKISREDYSIIADSMGLPVTHAHMREVGHSALIP